MQDAILAAGGGEAYRRLSAKALWFCLSCQNICCLTGHPFNVLQYLKTAEEMEEEQWRVTGILHEAMDETMRHVTAHLEAQG